MNKENKSFSFFCHAIENYSPCAPINIAERYHIKYSGHVKYKSYDPQVWPKLQFLSYYKSIEQKTKQIVIPSDEEVLLLWWSELASQGTIDFVIKGEELTSEVRTTSVLYAINIYPRLISTIVYSLATDMIVHSFTRPIKHVDIKSVTKDNIQKLIAKDVFLF